MEKIFSRFGLNNSKVILALTEDMKKEIQKITNKKIEIIPNGIDNEKFKLNKFETRKILGINEKEKIIIFVGRLEPVKGIKYLIESINILNETENNLKLLIIGEGNEDRELKRLVKRLGLCEEIKFLGKIINEKIPEYLVASDIFVLPSLSEGFPVVLLEAMASGLPIITTKIRGLAEIIQENVNGFTVKPENPNEIAEKMDLILNNKPIVEKFYIENKKKSRLYNWSIIVKRLELLYNI